MKFLGMTFGRSKDINNSNSDIFASPFNNEKVFAKILVSKNNRAEIEKRINPSKYGKQAPYFTLNEAQNYLMDLSEFAAEFAGTRLSIQLFETNVNGMSRLTYNFVCDLSTTYEDFLKLVFEDIFNNEENRTSSYTELAKFAEELKKEYAKSTGKSEDTLVEIPSQTEAEFPTTEINFPSHEYSADDSLDLQGGFSENENNDYYSQEDNLDLQGGFSENQYSDQNGVQENYSENYEESVPVAEEKTEEKTEYSRNKISKIRSTMIYDPDYIKERLNISDNLALFTTSDELPDRPKDDTSEDYVKINDNNNRKEANERIKLDIDKLQNVYASPLIENANKLDNELEEELAKWEEENRPNDDIYNDINAQIETEKANSIEATKAEVEANKTAELNGAKQEYETKVAQINTKFQNKLNTELSTINKTFSQSLQDEKQKVYDQAVGMFEKEKEKIYVQLLNSKKKSLEKDITKARETLISAADKIIATSQSKLKAYKDELNEEYYHNLQIKNEEDKKASEEQRKQQMQAELERHHKANEENEQKSQQVLNEVIKSNEKLYSAMTVKNEVAKDNAKLDKVLDLMLVGFMDKLQKDEDTKDDSKSNVDQEVLNKLNELSNSTKEANEKIQLLEQEKNKLNEDNLKTKKRNKYFIIGMTVLGLALGGGTATAVAMTHSGAESKPVTTNTSTNAESSSTTASSASSASSSNNTRPISNASEVTSTPKTSEYENLLKQKSYIEAATKYPKKINDIETHIYHNKDLNSLNQFNKVYSVRFGYLDSLLLQNDNANDIYNVVAQYRNLNFEDKKRAAQIGKKMLELNKVDVARIINAYQPSQSLSNAISKY